MMTVYEERGQLKEAQRALLTVMDARFGEVPIPVNRKVEYCRDVKKLENALRKVATIKSLDEFTI